MATEEGGIPTTETSSHSTTINGDGEVTSETYGNTIRKAGK